MTTITLELNLPDTLAQFAQQSELLTPDAIRSWIEREWHKQQLREHLAKVALDDEPPMSIDEINAEIAAVRYVRRS